MASEKNAVALTGFFVIVSQFTTTFANECAFCIAVCRNIRNFLFD